MERLVVIISRHERVRNPVPGYRGGDKLVFCSRPLDWVAVLMGWAAALHVECPNGSAWADEKE